jgi:hypothetical protein
MKRGRGLVFFSTRDTDDRERERGKEKNPV